MAQEVMWIEPEGNSSHQPFYLAIEPITNQEYFQFMLQDGYQNPIFWDSEGWQKKALFQNSQGECSPRTWQGCEFAPQQANQAVLGISFYEAQAYARYLGWLVPTREIWSLIQSIQLDIGPYPWPSGAQDNVTPIYLVRYCPGNLVKTGEESWQLEARLATMAMQMKAMQQKHIAEWQQLNERISKFETHGQEGVEKKQAEHLKLQQLSSQVSALLQQQASILSTLQMAELCCRLGTAYEKEGQVELALVWFQSALQFYPQFQPARQTLTKQWAAWNCPKDMLAIPGVQQVSLGSSDDPEFPLEHATISSFYLDRYEVTQRQFAEFIESSGYQADSYWSPAGLTWRGWRNRPQDWHFPTPEEEDLPISNISYYEAEAYAAWAGKRLPTAQEWEYAARGTDARKFPWGNEPPQMGQWFRANYRQVQEPYDGVLTKSKIHAFPYDRGFFGNLGMAGNVAEWTTSTYIIPESKRVLQKVKGGSFQHLWLRLHCFTFIGQNPTDAASYIGFRCAKDVPPLKLP